jgi:hypothetical protein
MKVSYSTDRTNKPRLLRIRISKAYNWISLVLRKNEIALAKFINK